MPKWIHDRARHLRNKNPEMSESQSFAIATQQAHASGKSPKKYGTVQGRVEANQKYDRPAGAYEQKANPPSSSKTAGVLGLLGGLSVETEVQPKEIAMHPKLAGRLPLQAMISQHIEAAREKLAAEEKDEKDEKKVEKHGGKLPSKKEEETEKKASIDFTDPDDIEKLATALEVVAEKIAGDGVFLGGEKPQGGQVLPTMGRVAGKQSNKKDAAKHQLPMTIGSMATIDNPGAATAVPTDDSRAPGGNGAKYPAKGVLKTAGQSVMERIEAKKAEMFAEVTKTEEPAKAEPAEKQAAAKTAVDFILGKIAEVHGGGETLDDQKAPVPSNAGRQLISSNAAPVSATKKDAKAPRKAELKQVLTEPAMTRSTDSKVHENLRNADKGGVKIAAAKALLKKIAAEGCGCEGKGECRHCRLSQAIEAKKAS
jgi:hypothetical protein